MDRRSLIVHKGGEEMAPRSFCSLTFGFSAHWVCCCTNTVVDDWNVMEPLSIVVGTLTLTAVVRNTLQAVEHLHRLPSTLRQLLQETTDLALVLHHVEILLSNDAAANSPLSTTQLEAEKLGRSVERLHMVLSDVDAILKEHVVQQPALTQDADGKSPSQGLSNMAKIPSITSVNNTKSEGPQQKIKVSWISGRKALTSLSKLRNDLKSTKQSLILILTLIAG